MNGGCVIFRALGADSMNPSEAYRRLMHVLRTNRSTRRSGKLKRRLRGKTLETRQLLAADFNGVRHNALAAEGINNDGDISTVDALVMINVLSGVTGEGTRNDRGLSAFLYVWGQFVDHDIDLSEPQQDGEAFDIVVPTGDPWFDPTGTGERTIPLTRSQFDPATGTSVDNPRQQINSITAFIDGSMVYGSDQPTADGLRSFEGGRLLIDDSGLLLLDDSGSVLAGDIRASENLSLTAMHTLFVREHNRLADQIADANPELTDEQIYQQARAVVIAEIQAITFNEFLPALLGTRAISSDDGYDSTVNPSIANEFSTAAYRFGHSTLNDDIEFFDSVRPSSAERIGLRGRRLTGFQDFF